VRLCKAIISLPISSILDETDQHLDTQSIEWTEEFLAKLLRGVPFCHARQVFSDSIRRPDRGKLATGRVTRHDGNLPRISF